MTIIQNPESQCEEIRDAYVSFFDALSKGGIKSIVHAAYDIFQSPILVTDEKYRLLYCYPTEKMGQEIWDELYENGVLRQEIIREYQVAYLQKQGKTYEPFYSNNGPASDAPRIFGEIYTDQNQILGHVAIFLRERSLGEHDLTLTKIFIDALRIQMSRYVYSNAMSFNYLLDLLTPEISMSRKILAQNVLNDRLKKNFCLAVTSVGETAADNAFVSTAINHMNNAFRNTLSTIYNGSIVTLFGEISDIHGYRSKERRFLTSALALLEQSFSNVGISRPFDNLLEIGNFFSQAALTARLPGNGIRFFEDMAPSQFFLPVLDYGKKEAFLHPILEDLIKYDQENNTQYFLTLKTYSLCIHDKERTARELHIHRNTLLYRLNRIQDLFQISFEDQNTALHLINSFQFWELLEKNKKE